MDDILIHSPDVATHKQHVERVIERLVEKKLKIKRSKCDLVKPEVKFLGHIISHGQISTDPEKIKAVQEFPIPQTLQQLQSFMGLAGYYRKHIDSFA